MTDFKTITVKEGDWELLSHLRIKHKYSTLHSLISAMVKVVTKKESDLREFRK